VIQANQSRDFVRLVTWFSREHVCHMHTWETKTGILLLDIAASIATRTFVAHK